MSTPDQAALIRVLQLGNHGSDAGGISAVLHEYGTWTWPASTHRLVDTYAQDPRLFGAGRWLAASRVVLCEARRFDVAHVHLSNTGSFLREGSLAHLARRRGLAVVVTIHGSGFDAFATRHPSAVRAALAPAHRVLTFAPSSRDALRSLGVDARLTANSAGPLVASAPESQNAPAGRRSLVFAGAVSRRKGVDVLLDAWQALGDAADGWRLELLGPVAPDLRDRLKAAPRDVNAPGAQPRAVVLDAIAGAGAVVLPSRAEAFPMVILEAMARARPVVATAIAGVPRMLGDGAPLVAPGDPSELRDALARVLTDASLRRRLGAANHQRYADQFTPRAVALSIEAAYRDALAARRGTSPRASGAR